MSRTLTIVGASVRAAAQSAARAGFTVRAGDMFADVDLAELCEARPIVDYPAGLDRVVRGTQPGPWMYTGALENHPRIVGRLARERPLLGNPAKVLVTARDPQRLARVLSASGILCPQVAADPAGLPREGTWLRKPRRSAGGNGIVAYGASIDRQPASKGSYFQEYVEGMACSAVYLGAGGRSRLLGTTRQLIGAAWTGADGFRYCGSIGPLLWSREVTAAFVRIGEVLVGELGLRGLLGVDAVVNQRGVWLIEVNPRYTASVEILEWATGIPAVERHVAACESDRLPDIKPAHGAQVCGKAIVFAVEPTAVAADLRESLGEARRAEWPTLADIPAPGTAVKQGWPIVTVLAQAADEAQVIEQLREKCAQVRSAVRTFVQQ